MTLIYPLSADPKCRAFFLLCRRGSAMANKEQNIQKTKVSRFHHLNRTKCASPDTDISLLSRLLSPWRRTKNDRWQHNFPVSTRRFLSKSFLAPVLKMQELEGSVSKFSISMVWRSMSFHVVLPRTLVTQSSGRSSGAKPEIPGKWNKVSSVLVLHSLLEMNRNERRPQASSGKHGPHSPQWIVFTCSARKSLVSTMSVIGGKCPHLQFSL